MPEGAEFMGDKELEERLQGWVYGEVNGAGDVKYGINVGEELGGEEKRGGNER